MVFIILLSEKDINLNRAFIKKDKMEITVRYETPACIAAMREHLNEQRMIHYASEINSGSVVQAKLTRAMKLFVLSGLSIDDHFKRIFKCSSEGTYIDWKLSGEAFNTLLFSGEIPEPLIFGYLNLEISENFIHEHYAKNKREVLNTLNSIRDMYHAQA
jgi:hypothetical protein